MSGGPDPPPIPQKDEGPGVGSSMSLHAHLEDVALLHEHRVPVFTVHFVHLIRPRLPEPVEECVDDTVVLAVETETLVRDVDDQLPAAHPHMVTAAIAPVSRAVRRRRTPSPAEPARRS